ncbi:diablo homolog, mitochondrial-like [Notolabrus celidotus]|uniref:diablo homolog, mitochondrial-like n=1 Tax=Notolabrus celidotus TaxID=1203425 RepID=UPI0014904704|nr:diablo homolog, mitochondrial-like [Notolabrus celidotus]
MDLGPYKYEQERQSDIIIEQTERFQAANNRNISSALRRQDKSDWTAALFKLQIKLNYQRYFYHIEHSLSAQLICKMQAVRQCSVCTSRAAGGLLRNQTDFSFLRTNKNVVRRGATCVRFLSISESGQFKSGVQKKEEKTNTAPMSLTSTSSARGLNAFPFTQHVENLSQDSLIRRAASVVTDGSSIFLSQTTLALIDALTDYSKAVHTRVAFQRRYLATLGKLTAAEEDSLLEVISVQRAEASERLEDCKRFESTWINAVNLCKMATEAAHSTGAEHASISVRTNMQVAQSQVEEARKLSADADKKLAETKVEEIQRMAEYASFRWENEEHEVHEAYLRED